MKAKSHSNLEDGIRVGELIWPAAADGARAGQQERHLVELLKAADVGLMIDCSLVEIGNSEIINVLMRVRNQAKKNGSEIVLINSPETLNSAIRLCNLNRILPTRDDRTAATKLLLDHAVGKAQWRIWLETHKAFAALFVAISIVGLGLAVYLISR